jgi:hypothetical protein
MTTPAIAPLDRDTTSLMISSRVMTDPLIFTSVERPNAEEFLILRGLLNSPNKLEA